MKRKIYFVVVLTVISTTYLGAQGITDLLKYSDNTIMGTARYMGMAGSFGALGGDPSAIIDNPAAVGIYRSSEMTFSFSPTITQTVTSSTTSRIKESDFYFNFSNAAIVMAFPNSKNTGIVSTNFSFSYNRLKDFHRTIGYRNMSPSTSLASSMAKMTDGFFPSAISSDNEYVPYLSDLAYNGFLIDPIIDNNLDTTSSWAPISQRNLSSAYYAVERGRVEEYNFAYGMNISHKVYLGVSLGIQSLYYSITSENSESYNNSQRMSLINSYSTTGTGFNFGFGVIVRATSFLRLAASIHTPTYYDIYNIQTGKIRTLNTFPGINDYEYKTPSSGLEYEFSTPLRFMASAGFIIGKKAIVNVEYQLTDYNSTMRFDDDYYGDYLSGNSGFQVENMEIARYAKVSHTIKLGAEYRIASTYSLRAGFSYVSPSVSENVSYTILDNTTRTDMDYYFDKGSLYGSIGFGYRYNGFGVDIAYLYRNKLDGFSTYQVDAELLDNGRYGVPEDALQKPRNMTNIETHKHNIALTFTYKF